MIVDPSALVAIVMAEPGWPEVKGKLDAAPRRLISAPGVAELMLVLTIKGRGDARLLVLDLLREAEIEVAPFEEQHLAWFAHAVGRYGKGRHKAALNFGDCFSYALAKSTGLPLLYLGDDFTHTDLALRTPTGSVCEGGAVTQRCSGGR